VTGDVRIPDSDTFPNGTTIAIFNNSGATLNVNSNTGILRLAGTTSASVNGSEARHISPYGTCTLLKIASGLWVISGAVS
jgi:hypothetical protein